MTVTLPEEMNVTAIAGGLVWGSVCRTPPIFNYSLMQGSVGGGWAGSRLAHCLVGFGV